MLILQMVCEGSITMRLMICPPLTLLPSPTIHTTYEHLTVLDLIYYQQLCLTAAEDPPVESCRVSILTWSRGTD